MSFTTVIDFNACMADSPSFRTQLGQHETNLDELETRLEKVMKSTSAMSEAGRVYVTQMTQFMASLWELSSYFAGDKESHTISHLNRLIQTFQEIIKIQNVVVDQSQKAISRSVGKFIKEDIKQMKDTKGYFNKISNDLDSALRMNAAASKNRPSEMEDATNLLTATKSCFRYTALDYVYQISMLQSKKKCEVLDAMLTLIRAYGDFFQQGKNIFGEIKEFQQSLGEEIKDMRSKTSTLEKNMEKRHAHISQAEEQSKLANSDVKLEGYLFKRGQNAFRTWNRRWFYLQNKKLCYSKRSGEDVTIMEEDLRICLVRPFTDIDRRFCFEVLSPGKSHVLQADSEEIAKFWITNLQQEISSALHQTIAAESSTNNDSAEEPLKWEDSDNEDSGGDANKSKGSPNQRSAKQIVLIPGNDKCCDCGASDPKWASINLGITLCIECSGFHRSLGVHITKVRSITLDTWEPEILKVMAELGNKISNQIYEANVHEVVAKRANPNSSKAEREDWIKAKYVTKAFIKADILELQNTSSGHTGKWTVRRLRRRARTSSLKKETPSAKEKLDKDEKDVDTKEASSNSKTNVEEIIFGSTLGKHHIANIELDSDQESTDGEIDDERLFNDEQLLAKLSPDHLLFRAARVHNLPVMSQALALGADRDWIASSGSAVIHQSILSGSVMACEFLLLNGAKINSVDLDGNTPLHLASSNGNTGQVCLLLKHRANHQIRNKAGKQALDIAVQNSDADIVTLLRLAALNEEIRESDFGSDDTFNDVVQEFSQMVYTHPERLNKKSEAVSKK